MSDLGKYILKTDGQDFRYGNYTLHRQTTDATATELSTNGLAPSTTNLIKVPIGKTFFVTAKVVARQNTGANNASFMRYFIIENTGGTTTLVGSVTTLGTDLGSNGGAPPAGWGVSITANDTNDTIKLDVTGAAATTINWFAKIETIEVG